MLDVATIAEVSPRAVDEAVMELAYREARIVLTEDKDFGQLVYAATRASAAVILVRFPATARKQVADAVLEVVRRRGDRLVGSFVVVQPGRVRIKRTPHG